MPSILPTTLLSLANTLIPPVDPSLSLSDLLFSTSNPYVKGLIETFFDCHSAILSDFPFDSNTLESTNELKTVLIEYGYSPETVSRFLTDFVELLLVSCFASPEILAGLELLPSHLYSPYVDI
jgi:hypothetical protein